MARYIKEFQISISPNIVFNEVNQYLMTEGYEYIQYDNENVFKKGKGFMGNPTFFKFSFLNNVVRFETWMKYSLFPGLYVGEEGVNGIVGAAVKEPWKRRIAQVESILAQHMSNSFETAAHPPASAVYTEGHSNNNMFCSKCGAQHVQGAAFCSNCGQALMQAQAVNTYYNNSIYGNPATPQYSATVKRQYISKREFRNNYVPTFKKDIKSIAILCYVCAGLTGVVSLAVNSLGWIDAILLLGVTLGMHLGKSKVCAIILLVLACIEAVAGIVLIGTPSAVLWVLAGIWAVVTFNKADKQYKNYISGK